MPRAKPVDIDQPTIVKGSAKNPNNLPVNYEEEMRKELEQVSSRTQAASGDKIRPTKKKTFQLPDGTETEGPLPAIIVDYISINQFYDQPYKEGAATAPACFAIGLEPSKLTPSKNSPDMQSDEGCGKCPNNQWGSAGDGKACSNIRRLAVLPADAKDDTPLWIIDVSPTATKGFDAYVNTLKNKLGKPPVGVVTEIYFDDKVDYQKLCFGNPKPCDKGQLGVAFAKRSEARQRLLQEPDVGSYEAPKRAPAKGRRATA